MLEKVAIIPSITQITNVVAVTVFLLNRNITEIIASCGTIECHAVKKLSELLINGLKTNAEVGIKIHTSFLSVFLISKYVKNKTPAYIGN